MIYHALLAKSLNVSSLSGAILACLRFLDEPHLHLFIIIKKRVRDQLHCYLLMLSGTIYSIFGGRVEGGGGELSPDPGEDQGI